MWSSPADETVVAAYPLGNSQLVDTAVAAARRAFPKWSAVPDSERVTKLNAIADLVEKHHKELAELVTREQGKTQSGPGANLELGGAAAWTRVTASLALPEQVIQDDAAGKIVAHRKPVGVVGSITPWNWPLLIAVWHVGMPAISRRLHGWSPFQALALHPAIHIAARRVDEPGSTAGSHQCRDRRPRGGLAPGHPPGHRQDRIHRLGGDGVQERSCVAVPRHSNA